MVAETPKKVATTKSTGEVKVPTPKGGWKGKTVRFPEQHSYKSLFNIFRG